MSCKSLIQAGLLTLQDRNPLHRFQVIMGELTRHKTAAKALAEQLEVHPKTIYRDVDFLRYLLEVPIEATPEGFQLTSEICLCAICSGVATVAVKPTYELGAPLERYLPAPVPKKLPTLTQVAAERQRLIEAAALRRARVAV